MSCIQDIFKNLCYDITSLLLGGCCMRKVELRMNEENKYLIIKKLVETNGNKNRAAIKLGCTVRTVNRLILKYKKYGKAAFIHGNRGRAPATTIPLDIKNRIIKLYIDHYCDTNFTHFCEIIYDDFNVKISDTTLNKWLRDENIISPKARKKTRKILKDSLKAQLKMTRSKKSQNDIKEAISIIDSKNAHPRRPRCKYMGEMIQMDASSFEWIDGHIWHLHLAVDDATGEVVGAYFDTQETLNGYYNVFYQILTNYGIPAMFYTDRRTVFEYKKKNNAFDDDDTFTQFSYACHNLGVDIRTTSIAQAKGRIERMNQTFQSRLPVELRRAHITDIESANKFLKSYLKKFNDMFALHLNTTKSVFETQPSIEKINRTLAVLSPRKIDSGHSIRFQNRLYLPVTENGTSVYLKNRTDCMVIEAFDGNLYVNVLDHIYIMQEIPKHELYSKEFDEVKKEARPRKKYIPPIDHPWKQASYLNFLAKQKHRSGANV